MPSNENWSDEELRAAVDAYLEMFAKHRAGEVFSKKSYYQDLAQRFNRTAKSFEYRAQNISHVLALQGRAWMPGLVPARNVGARVVGRIEGILAEAEGTPNTKAAEREARDRAVRAKAPTEKPEGSDSPPRSTTQTVEYARDPEVKAWVLERASGSCEQCGGTSGFENTAGQPYLEVHHVRRLADGGSDTVENAVGLCPNCHRALHYAADREDRVESLYRSVGRLKRE